MSELGFLAFGSADEVDPVEAMQQKASAIENVNRELDERGITAFALQADSAPEVEQRLLMREVSAAIDEIVERYLPEDDDAKKRVVSNIFRQFEAKKTTDKTVKVLAAAEDDDFFPEDGQESRNCINGNHSDCENCSCGCHSPERGFSGACLDSDHGSCTMDNCTCGCHPDNSLTDDQAESYRGWDESRER